MRRLAVALTLVVAASMCGCGARTELEVSASDTSDGGGRPTRRYTRVGIFGNQGAYGEAPLLAFLAEHHTVTRTQTDGSPLTSDALAAFDLVILDELVRDYSSDEARAFERWVAAGGGIVSLSGFVGTSTDTERPNSLLAEIGLAYEQPLLPPSDNPAIVSFAKHPLTRGLHSVVFFGGYAVRPASSATALAFAQDASLVAAAAPHGAGRVYLWGDEWVSYAQEWSPETRRFWSDAVAWLSHED